MSNEGPNGLSVGLWRDKLLSGRDNFRGSAYTRLSLQFLTNRNGSATFHSCQFVLEPFSSEGVGLEIISEIILIVRCCE